MLKRLKAARVAASPKGLIRPGSAASRLLLVPARRPLRWAQRLAPARPPLRAARLLAAASTPAAAEESPKKLRKTGNKVIAVNRLAETDRRRPRPFAAEVGL